MKKIFTTLIIACLILTSCSLITGQHSICYNTQDQEGCLAELGINNSDLSYCQNLKNQTKFYCYEKVAEKTNNLDLCYNINNTYWSNICFKHFAVSQNRSILCLKIQNEKLQKECYKNIALNTNDPELCLFLEDTEKNRCLMTIAKSTLDITHCHYFEEELNQNICLLRIAQSTNQSNLCNNLTISVIRKDCFNATQN